jgi:YNFM family putative membrane transporter
MLENGGLMGKKQLLALFVSSFVIWTIGNGLLPLLPVYARKLGADSSVTGYYLAFSYLALTFGALSAGWISERLQRRKMPFIIAGLASIPAAWLIGRVEEIWSLTILTALLWFCGGVGLALAGIITGMSAGKDERGKIFGILSLTGGLGALLGGLSAGFIVDHWGFPAMFTAMAVLLVCWPVAGSFLVEKETIEVQGEREAGQAKPPLGNNYYLLFFASLISSVAGFIVILGRSLMMNDMQFGAMSIASTGAIGGLVGMPIPFLMGWLSDRMGRKIFLYLSYTAGMVSLVVLIYSSSLWHFWVVIALQSIFGGANGTIGSALIADLVPKESLGRGLSLFSATAWIGGVLGFGSAGLAFKNFGVFSTLIVGIGLVAIAIALLIPIHDRMKR